MDSSYSSSTTKPLFKSTQIIWYTLSLLEIALVFRFLLKFTGANPEAGFTGFVYNITWPFATPFLTVFPQSVVERSIFEWTTLLAMLVYYMIAFGIIRLLLLSRTVSTSEAAIGLERQE